MFFAEKVIGILFNSWDEWVDDERIVKYNEQGLQKQKELRAAYKASKYLTNQVGLCCDSRDTKMRTNGMPKRFTLTVGPT